MYIGCVHVHGEVCACACRSCVHIGVCARKGRGVCL